MEQFVVVVFFPQLPNLPSHALYQVPKNPIHFSRIESYPFIEPLKLPVPTGMDFNSHADNRELLESYLVLGIHVSQVPNNEKVSVISLYARSSLKQRCPENNSSLIVLLLYCCASIFLSDCVVLFAPILHFIIPSRCRLRVSVFSFSVIWFAVLQQLEHVES